MNLIRPDEGTRYDSMGDAMRIVLTAADTAGEYTLIEDTLKPGFHAALHLHRRHTESFYILEGEVTFTLGTQELVATPGATVIVPPGLPHAARAAAPARMLTIFSPGGLEGALEAFRRMTPEEAAAPSAARAVMNEYDIVDLSQPGVGALTNFYDTLKAGDFDALQALFAGEPRIDTPLDGPVRGAEQLQTFVAAQQDWLTARNAAPRVINAIVDAAHIVVELVLDYTDGSAAIDLPIALVAERADDQLVALRIYHSTWPLTGGHQVRAPLLPLPATPPQEPAVIHAYMDALHRGDGAALQALFTSDGYVREPSGTRYRHAGPDGRVAFYAMAVGDGGVVLHHHSATFDGASFAVEYTCDRWGRAELPPQAGMAVYDLAGDDRLHAVRIYDDVDPPLPHA